MTVGWDWIRSSSDGSLLHLGTIFKLMVCEQKLALSPTPQGFQFSYRTCPCVLSPLVAASAPCKGKFKILEIECLQCQQSATTTTLKVPKGVRFKGRHLDYIV